MRGMGKLETYLTTHAVRQHEFATIVGVSQATVSKLINGSVQPSLDLAVRIQRATGGAVPADSWIAPAQTEEDAA